MPAPSGLRTSPFFLLRAPSLPLATLLTWSEPEANEDPERDRDHLRRCLRELAARPQVREALALASPDLVARLDPWLTGELKGKAARNLEHGLVKYLSRMAFRCTPFGLFAGVTVGSWGERSALELGAWETSRKVARLDWGVLEALRARLEREPWARDDQIFRPNTSLYPVGGWHRYLEAGEDARGERAYRLESVQDTPQLAWALRAAQPGASFADLARGLAVAMDTTVEEAGAYLDLLIGAQVLVGDLQAPLTEDDPLRRLRDRVARQPLEAPRVKELERLEGRIRSLETAVAGAHPEGLQDLEEPLAALGVPAWKNPVQLDLHRASPGLVLGPAVRKALEAGIETLRNLTPPGAGGTLRRFREAFVERYGTRWVPLPEALDEEAGLGFDAEPPLDSPLLEGFPLATGKRDAGRRLTARDTFLFGRLQALGAQDVWELDDADLAALAAPNPAPLPTSFSALVSLSAPGEADLDGGAFQFWMENYTGPSAARLLARFAPGDGDLAGQLETELLREEELRPGAVFAEVMHLPEGRMGNLLARPRLRRHEIPFLAPRGVDDDHTLLAGDLRLRVEGDRFILASARLGREVLPRLASAYNFNRGPAAYRFLGHLQDQDTPAGGWSWGALADLPRLPRVTRGRHVLSKARWRITGSELDKAMAGARGDVREAFRGLRRDRGLPRHVVLAEADNALPVDLERVVWVETLHHLVAGRASFTLVEPFPPPEAHPVRGPEGACAHELIVPFRADAPAGLQAPTPTALDLVCPRAHAPGSDWLYLKVYCGPATADQLLAEWWPLLQDAEGEGLFDRWFFVRYRDPGHHLRLRFQGDPGRLLGTWLPRLHGVLGPALAQGRVWKVQADTYEPEIERYGGPALIGFAEAWFCEDSRQVLAAMAACEPGERWREGLRDVDRIWARLGLDLTARKELAERSRASFRKEFEDPGEGAAWMGDRFRELRRALEDGFASPEAPGDKPASDALGRLRTAWDLAVPTTDLPSLASSLAHMHLNRLLRTDARANEWVLMEFLARLYASRLARTS